MFKKSITFMNFNDEEVTKEFYFHMSKAELLEMAADGNAMMKRIQRIIDSKDGKAILKEFRELISASVGRRSEDGNHFVKDAAAQADLMESPAYDELLMELSTQADASAEFVRQLIPEKMQKDMIAQMEKQKTAESTPSPFGQPTEHELPAWIRDDREPTQAELQACTPAQLQEAFSRRIEKHKHQQ